MARLAILGINELHGYIFFSPEETNSTTTSPGDGQETVTRSRGHGQRHSHRQGHRHGV